LSKIIHLNGDSRFTEDDSPWGPAPFSEIGSRQGDSLGRAVVDSPEDMLTTARNEAQRIRDDAYKEGYEAGRSEATGEVAGEATKLLETIRGLNVELRNEEQRMIEELEPRLVELAVQIAQKILHHELTRDALKEFKLDIAESFDGVREVNVLADENIARGGCIVETDMLRVNGDIDAQLKEIHQQLME